jgi:trans-aconitate methyltransferase
MGAPVIVASLIFGGRFQLQSYYPIGETKLAFAQAVNSATIASRKHSTAMIQFANAQTWDAANYAQQGRFVADLAGGVFELLAPQAGERILDLGCGDGALTAKIAAAGAEVIGVDSSPSMVEAARARQLDARLLNAESLPFEAEFDAVFSNAALHWVREQGAMLAGVHRALKPGGRFVAEMGGFGNIASIRVALAGVLRQWGLDAYAMDNNFFPAVADYHGRLEAAGFSVETIGLIPRPTPLPEAGMRGWLETFRRGLLDQLPESRRERALEETVALLKPVLHSVEGGWVADYVRLRFLARA